MKITDFKYFNEKTAGHVMGEYGKCAVCGKKSQKLWIAFGLMQQFHFCSTEHRDLFLNQTVPKGEETT